MTLRRPPTPPSPLLPRILEDEWEPPPRVTRFPVGITAAGLVTICIAAVAVRAALSAADSTRAGRDPGNYTRAFADTATAPLDPEFPPPRSSGRRFERRSVVPPAPAPAPVTRVVRPSTRPVASRPAPSAPGYLAVNSTPWAELAVDGHVVGNTPQVRVTVKPGPHQLVFSRDGFETRRTWVTVESGATVRITDITLKRTTP